MLKGRDRWLVVSGQFRIAREISQNDDGSTTFDLYRNLKDYDLGVVMELDFVCWPIRRQPKYPDCYPSGHLDWSAGDPLH